MLQANAPGQMSQAGTGDPRFVQVELLQLGHVCQVREPFVRCPGGGHYAQELEVIEQGQALPQPFQVRVVNGRTDVLGRRGSAGVNREVTNDNTGHIAEQIVEKGLTQALA